MGIETVPTSECCERTDVLAPKALRIVHGIHTGSPQDTAASRTANTKPAICKIDLLHSLKAAAKATISWPKVKRGARKFLYLSFINSQNLKKLAEQLQRTQKYITKMFLRKPVFLQSVPPISGVSMHS